MEILSLLIVKLIPLYTLVAIGFVAGKYLNVQKESVATLLIYIISPIVIFSGVVVAPKNFATFSLPILAFCIGTLLCLFFYILGGRFWSGSEKNILAFSAGAGNIGYFGLPVAITLFGQGSVSYAVLFIFGLVMYESTVGFYITAKGSYSAQESLRKVVKLPTVYAFILGVVLNLSGINFSTSVQDLVLSFRGAYSVLGMMLVGLGLAGISSYKLDYKFISFSFFAKFVAYPVCMALLIFFDMHYFHLYSKEIYQVLVLMSVVPLASNTVAFSVKLGVHPEKMSVAVFLSTMIAIVHIPCMIMVMNYVL